MEENIVFAKVPYQYTMYLNRHLIQATACLSVPYAEISVSHRGNSRFQPWELEFPAWKREFKRKEPILSYIGLNLISCPQYLLFTQCGR